MSIDMLPEPPLSIHQPPSAYGKVAQYIIDGLPEYKFGYTPMGKSNQLGIFKWRDNLYIYPSGNQNFGEDVICDNAYHLNADLVFVLKDPFFVENANNFPLEMVWYCPVDYEDLHPHVEFVLKTAFKVVAMSQFGKREIERKKIKVDALIPHGVDLELYRPVEGIERENCKRFFNLDPYAFYVGFIGMNRPRKLVWRVLQVFRHLLDEAPDADIKFMLWTNVYSEIPLLTQIAHLGLSDTVYWPSKKAYNMGIPEDMMYKFYNACDVLICVSGEGFWLPGVEAMACGIPTIAVDYAAAPELALLTADMEQAIWGNRAGVKQPLVDLDDMVSKILYVYNTDWEKLRRKQLRRVKKYAWKSIIPKWRRFFDECEVELKPLVTKGGIKKWDKVLE